MIQRNEQIRNNNRKVERAEQYASEWGCKLENYDQYKNREIREIFLFFLISMLYLLLGITIGLALMLEYVKSFA